MDGDCSQRTLGLLPSLWLHGVTVEWKHSLLHQKDHSNPWCHPQFHHSSNTKFRHVYVLLICFIYFECVIIPECVAFFQPTPEIWWLWSSVLLTNIQIISRILTVICHYIFTRNLNIIWAQKHLQIYINGFTFYIELHRFQNWGSRQNYWKLKQKLIIQL